MDKQNYEKKAYEAMKAKILNGHLRVGDRVPENMIAKELGISRTPVRRALVMLETEGFLTIESNRGAFVSESKVTVSHFIEMLEMLEILTTKTMEKIENKGIFFEKQGMDAYLHTMERCLERKDVNGFLEASWESIFNFMKYMGNTYAQSAVRRIGIDFLTKAPKEIALIPYHNGAYLIEQHVNIINALENREFEKAATLVRESVNYFIIKTFR
ncbi:GntR family transcriptional regulator [Listeria booriae]|uniref:GntR family transcriptional regulator n=1 Tax=Listeria booriae TaxID=1552123 RepID=UPI001624D3BB|nr:GntR family transcriptional regulator [Listeria booriae]MBC1574498.1 GntR family transcriptional regulator [Listeria booriae]MBC1917572.1 GntR family transcriptional regulator [Listeria booriae]